MTNYELYNVLWLYAPPVIQKILGKYELNQAFTLICFCPLLKLWLLLFFVYNLNDLSVAIPTTFLLFIYLFHIVSYFVRVKVT